MVRIVAATVVKMGNPEYVTRNNREVMEKRKRLEGRKRQGTLFSFE